MKKKELILTIAMVFLLSFSTSGFQVIVKADPRTIVVPTDYPTIKEAIGNAVDGDTIYVKKGTYQENNIVIDKSILVVGEDRESTIITSQSSQVMLLVNHSQVSITGFTLIASNTPKPTIDVSPYSKTVTAIQIQKSQYCNVSGNKIVNSGTAIWLESSSNNIIEANILWDNYYGVDITKISTNNIIRANDISANQVGIRFSDRRVNYTIVCANNITSSYTGLFYYFTSLNFVVGNYIAYNFDAIHFIGSYSNVLHHNNFVYNSKQVSDDSSYGDNVLVAYSVNILDDRKEGNYWSDYKGTGNDGIGATPYVLNKFNQDNFPLLGLVTIQEYSSYSSTQLPYPSPTQPPAPTPESSPSPKPSSSPKLSPYPTQSATPSSEGLENSQIPSSLLILIAIIVLALSLIAVLGVLHYKKKQSKVK